MARILFVASRFPHPPFRGDIVRTLQQIQQLGTRFDITLVAPAPPRGVSLSNTVINDRCEFIPVPLAGWHALRNVGAFFADGLPLQTAAFFSTAYSKAAAHALRRQSFDLAHVQMVRIGPIVNTLEGLPIVLDMIDTASLNMERRAAHEGLLLRGLVAWEARRLRAYERVLSQQCARVVVSSPADLQALDLDDRTRVVPFGIDLLSLPFVEGGREESEIVFTGRMGYFPNADAAVYFATDVFPLVRRSVAEARFTIVGIDPPSRVRALGRLPGVKVVPDSNLRTYLERATVAVAPLRSGTGLQIKVLEAMAKGAPVVATPMVSPAIAAVDGDHWFLAESPTDFAERVAFLLRNKEAARRMAHSARRFVETRFAQEVVVAQLGAIWDEVLMAARHKPLRQASG
ncbi:MAG TPA: glycosyltransferase family 4 protein [Anaerolineales bacterium]|nr:glycosyltransferase family 4 protein [Anaerolineales bacterium]